MLQGKVCQCMVNLAITGARQQGWETLDVLGHAVHPIPMTVQGGQERLCEHTLQLRGIQGPCVLPAHLKRMKRGVIVSRD